MSTRRVSRLGAALVALGVATVAAVMIGGSTATADSSPAPLTLVQANGERVYVDFCSACHMATGEGIEESIPPLIDSEWVEGDKGRLVLIIMHGVTGPIMVAGTEYSGMMPPLGGILNDEQIAAVATYVRTAWGNDASEVSVEDVASIRAANGDRTTPWTARELTSITSASSGN